MLSYIATTSFATNKDSFTKGKTYRFANKEEVGDFEECGFLVPVDVNPPSKTSAKTETATK